MAPRKTILILTSRFIPGAVSSGLIRSSESLARNLSAQHQVYVITNAENLGATYNASKVNTWLTIDQYQVLYQTPDQFSHRRLTQMILQFKPDFIYFNNLFSASLSFIHLWVKWRKLDHIQLIVSPSGSLKDSALQYRKWKKTPYLAFLKWIGLNRKIRWHATGEDEAGFIRKQIGEKSKICVAARFPPPVSPVMEPIQKKENHLSILFLARIHPIKNLTFLLNILDKITFNVQLSIAGSAVYPSYWSQCKSIIKSLPPNIKVDYLGDVNHRFVEQTIKEHHLLALPTKGENFCYSIIETLALGRPVLISDQTPWRNLEQQQAGWDLPLDDEASFIKVLNTIGTMNQSTYNQWCNDAWNYAKAHVSNSSIKEQYAYLFQSLQSEDKPIVL